MRSGHRAARLAAHPRHRIARRKNYYRYKTGRPLPIRWTAPEVLKDQAWTASSDMYSFGVLIYEVCVRLLSCCRCAYRPPRALNGFAHR